jgi:hypothetical protein
MNLIGQRQSSVVLLALIWMAADLLLVASEGLLLGLWLTRCSVPPEAAGLHSALKFQASSCQEALRVS